MGKDIDTECQIIFERLRQVHRFLSSHIYGLASKYLVVPIFKHISVFHSMFKRRSKTRLMCYINW